MPFLPTYTAKGTFQSGIAALTVPVPTGIRNNDLLLLFVESANEAIATPAGWTQVSNSPQGTGTAAAAGGVRLAVFWKLVSGPEGSVTVVDTGDHQTAVIAAIRGADPSSPIDVTAGSVDAVATTAMVFPTVTTSGENELIILAAAMDTDAASTTTMGAVTNANLTGITEIQDQTVIAGAGGGLAIAYGAKAAAGIVGTSTATGSTSVTHAYLTIAIKGMDTSVRTIAQYDSTDTNILSTGSTVSGGMTNGLTLVAEYSSGYYPDRVVTPKIEVEAVGTTFDKVATVTGRANKQETSDFNYGGRGGSLIHDTLNDRYIYFGGYDGTTRYNHTYAQDMRTPGNPWRKLAPTGTLPAGRNLGACAYVRGKASDGFDRAFLIIWGGFTTADTNDMWRLDLTTPGGESWSQITQTNAPSTRSYNMRHMVATPVAGDLAFNNIYLFGGWAGTPRTNALYSCSFNMDSPSAVTWNTLKAEGAAGNPTVREGAILDYKPSTSKLYLYGGYSGSAYLTDFWEYDIATNAWSQRTVTGTAPAGSDLGAGGYDAINNRFWFTGGWTAGAATSGTNQVGYINDVGGSESFVLVRAATDVNSNQSYPGNSSTSNCVDTIRGWLVLRGMATMDSTERYGYIIDFRETATSNFPVYGLAEGEFFGVRDATSTIYNPDRDEIVAIGGMGNFPDEATIVQGGHIDEIWAYNRTDNTWHYAVKGYKTICPQEGMVSCYDSTRGRILVFGGLNGGSVYSNEVWSLTPDGNGYYAVKRLTPSGTAPAPRWLGIMGYDAANDRAIVTLGSDDTAPITTVFTLNFSTSADGVWTQVTPTGTAPSITASGYFNDTANKRLYTVFGASNAGLTTASSTLAYLDYSTTNCAWTTIAATGGVARRTPCVAYDATNTRIIVFGGYTGSAEVTSLQYYNTSSGTAWTAAAVPALEPDQRRSAGAAFANGKLYIHSGRQATGAWYKNTWELTPNYATPNSSTWVNKTPRIYNRMALDYIAPTSGSYHWQAWATENSVDSVAAGYGANSDKKIQYISAASAAAATVTMPTHQAGDLLLIFAFRDGSTTSPTIPSGWTQVSASGVNAGTLSASSCAYKIATTSSETSGTWTGATAIAVHVYRNTASATNPAVNAGAQTGSTPTVNYSGITTMTGAGSSWVVAFAGSTSIDNALESPRAGMKLRTNTVDAVNEIAGFDTNGEVSSWAFGSTTVGGTAGNYITKTVELLQGPVTADVDFVVPSANTSTTLSLTDDFNDNSISSSWTNGDSSDPTQVIEQNQRIEITHNAAGQYNTLRTAVTYDISGKNYYVRVVDAGNQTLASHEAILGATVNSTNAFWMTIANGQIFAYTRVNGTLTQIGSGLTYSSATHAWLRISESGGVLYFDTSSDGLIWTNRWYVNNPFGTTTVYPYLQSGNWQAEASGSYAYFDNFNTLGTVSAVGYKKVQIAGVWTAKPVKYMIGGVWTTKPEKRWNGTAWV